MITVQRLSASSSSVDNLKANYDQSQIAEKIFKATDLRVSELFLLNDKGLSFNVIGFNLML